MTCIEEKEIAKGRHFYLILIKSVNTVPSTGLDPAEPYFEGAVEAVRLESRDADFVDVIHSDGSKFLGSLGKFLLLSSVLGPTIFGHSLKMITHLFLSET